MPADLRETLQGLQGLDFTSKGEAFVESRFLTPMLACLGYETHRDYEVVRHGDDGSAFRLHYPPVEKGAQRVKHYNPDYIPTIRKKMFWIIEAKSPKDVDFPFDAKYLVQGLQYCIHPEIQAKYLLVTNGAHSAVYDAHGAVFFDQDIYEPIIQFQSSEVILRWAEIYDLLSVEKIRTQIEADLKAMYDKLCLSSLDKTYPQRLLGQIGVSAANNARQIDEHVRRLYLEEMNNNRRIWRENLEQLDSAKLFSNMDFPLQPAGLRGEGHHFVEKGLAEGKSAQEIFRRLTANFDRQRIFRKMQTFIALCTLYRRTDDTAVRTACHEFFDLYKDADLPLLNQVECALIRLTRKISILSLYPPLRQQLQQQLATAPELIRFVRPPTVASQLYLFELTQNHQMFENIKGMTDAQLQGQLTALLAKESRIEADFRNARANLPDAEISMDNFDLYGMGGKNPGFRNILVTCNLEPRS